MTGLAALLAGSALLVLLSGRHAAPSRLVTVAGKARSDRGGARRIGPALACVVAGLMCLLVAPGVPGLAVGVAVAVLGPPFLRRLEPRAVRARRAQLARDLPTAMDLLASCLAGGADPARAAGAVAQAVGGPCGERFAAVAGSLRAGSPPDLAWAALADLGAADDPLAPVARLLSRAAVGGAPVAPAVQRQAADLRAARRGLAEQLARRVGVLAVAPLGLCFLPAFVLLGVVPVVLGLAGPVLTGR